MLKKKFKIQSKYSPSGDQRGAISSLIDGIQAGLGEYGRNQMVITPEFGPRVRFSKIITNISKHRSVFFLNF